MNLRDIPAVSFGSLMVISLLAAADPEPPIAPLLEGLGSHHHEITTLSPQAQRYFDQGLVLSFGFNHQEAARSFRQAQILDPECAMCFWGESLVLGPNINAGMDVGENPRAYAAVQRALALEDSATERERAYIEALAKRYAEHAPEDRGALDQAYAKAMGNVAERFPDDPDAASLYAEALMDTTPWDYWEDDGSPKPVTRTILATLETVLAEHPNHPLANHLYIHAVEKVHPERGIAAADRLRDLVPGAGHLVHMPGHIYIRVGRYAQAVLANEKAIAADDAYIAQCHAQGLYPVAYMPHNQHFLAAAASFIGESEKALDAARHMRAHQDPKLMREAGYETLQHYWALPYFVMVRFGLWDALLAEPKPADDLIYPTGIWHFARGLAHARAFDLDEARKSLAALTWIANDPEMSATRIWETNTMAQILAIAREVLAGEIAMEDCQPDAAVGHLATAVSLEDGLTYVEPSDWYVPARHHLGLALLAAERPAEAEAVYRKDLEIYPDNGWALVGLGQSLAAQGRTADAQAARQRFLQVWSEADIEIEGSRL
ncbi:tetratricopeptide repeat protein [Thiocapsa sp.]|uniref:tetratricopeptide repeat protein n=1 Tax=Thiocapsa sp. TaxID=2024551 RepID=UPI002CB62CAD|nr:tetratricopeptide repeat protein [Thiocapsa sp.]HSO83253.1 tetratricopeptide repeat protein [Thiocapsa sp.]